MAEKYSRTDFSLVFPDDPKIRNLCLDPSQAEAGSITITRSKPGFFQAKFRLGIDEGGPIVPPSYYSYGSISTWRDETNGNWHAIAEVNSLVIDEVFVPPALHDSEYTLEQLLGSNENLADCLGGLDPEQEDCIERTLGTIAIADAHVAQLRLPRLAILETRLAR